MVEMILAILSDTHNNRSAVRLALDIADRRGAEEIIHCGDLVTAGMLDLFRGRTLHYVTGNLDRDLAGLRIAIQMLGNGSTCDSEFRQEIDGIRILVLHGNRSNELAAAVQSGKYDFIFHGHSHRRRDEQIGRTRVINPGALGSVAMESRSFCLLDTKTRDLEFVAVDDTCHSPE